MKKGKYVAFVEWNWRKESVKNNAVFRTYGTDETTITVVNDANHPNFLKYVMRDCVLNHSDETFQYPWGEQLKFKQVSDSKCSEGDMMVVVIENEDSNYYVTVKHSVDSTGYSSPKDFPTNGDK